MVRRRIETSSSFLSLVAILYCRDQGRMLKEEEVASTSKNHCSVRFGDALKHNNTVMKMIMTGLAELSTNLSLYLDLVPFADIPKLIGYEVH